jgi:hypothetical protein
MQLLDLVFNHHGTLGMDCGQINDGVAQSNGKVAGNFLLRRAIYR